MAAETQPSFPTYAELTQTQGWAATAKATIAVPREAESISGGRYTEGQVLGVGGMGKVVLARDARIGRDVAVKVLHGERELEPDERARFLREAQVQGQLEHPSIVPVYDIDHRPDGSTFFTMRRVLGRTLAQILDDLRQELPAAKARYTQRELLTAFATVCLTIDYAHSRGVIHRDLKPANIMLGDFGEVYVLDWGLARLVDPSAAVAAPAPAPKERLTIPGAMMGTPLYMAPEQMGDPDVGPAADVFALGAILFELLTLERVRDAKALFAPVDARPSVRAPHRAIARELEMICVRATEEEPADRYASPRALQEAIAHYLEGDRELEQRRQVAAAHVEVVRAALARSRETAADEERERGIAVTELGRAVALDPHNTETFAMLGELMAARPQQVPHEVQKLVEAENDRVIHVGAKFSTIAMLAWWAYFPLMLWIGLADTSQLPWIAVPATIGIATNLIMARQKRVDAAIQYVTIIAMLAATAAVSRLYGPFVIVPTLTANYAIVLQTHPTRQFRIAAVIASTIAFLVPTILEASGAWPRSYAFGADGWTIVPQLLELPELGTYTFLISANLGMIVTPCLLVSRLRAELSDAQVRLAAQAWHFRRFGAQLIGKPA